MSEFKEKTEQELQKILTDKRKTLQEFRFNASGSKSRNVKEGRNLRRDIARILTELNKKV